MNEIPERAAFDVADELDGMRLDRVLARAVPERSRERLREMVEDGHVRVDGLVQRRPSTPVAAGQRVEAELEERDRARPGSAAGSSFTVLFEDEHLVALDKPAGMVVHPSATVRGGTVAELARERYGELPAPQAGNPAERASRGGIVHRLDADTSGVMLLARSELAAEELVRQFREREVEKLYLAVVHGEPRFDSDWIDAPIGRSPRSHDRMSVVPAGEGRAAETFYKVLERFGDLAQLECQPRTGRTHQIRVHLASIGHTVVGDGLYRGRRKLELPPGAPPVARHALHARRLSLAHPATGAPLVFEAPLPPDLARLVGWLVERRDGRTPGLT